jgi:hypothetical protein
MVSAPSRLEPGMGTLRQLKSKAAGEGATLSYSRSVNFLTALAISGSLA